MTPEQKAYLHALADVRSWHRWQIGQALGDMRTVKVHERAIAWLDELILQSTGTRPKIKLDTIAIVSSLPLG